MVWTAVSRTRSAALALVIEPPAMMPILSRWLDYHMFVIFTLIGVTVAPRVIKVLERFALNR